MLLGDVVDLLRSAEWARLWEDSGAAAWLGQEAHFKIFAGDYSEECAIGIVKKIRARYTGFSAALGALVARGMLTVRYTYGNHDFIAQLSRGVREELRGFFHLDHDDLDRPFDYAYVDPEASIYAIHGHDSYDPVNVHRQASGHWALGDAVILRIVNRFPQELCNALEIKPTSPGGRRYHEIDNIEPRLGRSHPPADRLECR